MPEYSKQFIEPDFWEHSIAELDGSKVGTLRIKPNRVLWKPANAKKFYSVSLDKFAQWVTGEESGARRTKS